jgi:sugar phosphate isomerase/epimerase
MGLDAIMANPQKAFDDAKALGQTWLTVPSLPSGPRATVDDWKRIAGQFNTAARQARAAGLRFAFHNHNAEFRKIGDVVPFDVLLDNTDPALVEYQLDIHWAVAGGADPLDYIRRYPKRFPMVHVKDSAGPPDHRQTELGQGSIPFAKIFAQAEQAGIKHWFIEHDSPADPMAFARNGYAYLSTLTF